MGALLQISLSNEAWEKRLRSTRHYLYNIDLENKTAFCVVCGFTSIHVLQSKASKKPKTVCISKFLTLKSSKTHEPRTKPVRKLRHLLSEIDSEKLTAVCAVCGPTDILKRFYKGLPCYDCATHRREKERKRRRSRYLAKSTKPNAHTLLFTNEDKKTGICSKCGPVTIYVWQGKNKVGRRCSNAPVSRIPEAREIREEINTALINTYKARNGCKNCGENSNLLRLTLYSRIGRKQAVSFEKLLKLNGYELMRKIAKCEVYCSDCR